MSENTVTIQIQCDQSGQLTLNPPTTTLTQGTWMVEWFLDTPDLTQEFEPNGIVPDTSHLPQGVRVCDLVRVGDRQFQMTVIADLPSTSPPFTLLYSVNVTGGSCPDPSIIIDPDPPTAAS